MRAGAGAPPPASFDDYVISHIGEIIAQATEESVWAGTAVAGKFNGFVGAVTGLLLPGVDATVVQASGTAAAFDASNIITNLQTAVADIPTAVLGKEDLHIYLNQKSYRYYISAISTLGYVNAYNMQGDYVPVFEGISIAVCNGMVDNEIVIAEKSNLFFGTDLISNPSIKLMDMSELDGSDNMRLVARYSAGVQTGVGADIVRLS
jgi:hypothetical protein